ncbi:hypothetical protein PRUPE_8G136800 [Prunus persica]|uniref:BHLH domain-containing protein n=1 Tax=Prunus persica TaxID=3760 RepID=A0A251MXI0_PRUPE|nr:hypothetical protein PRUPE_8G136800 [Prunus persica]
MAENDGLEGDHLAVTEGTSFSQLLFAADEGCGLGMDDETFNYTHSSAYSTQIKPPKMLCFGNYDHSHGDGLEIGFSETAKKSGVTCSDSSSVYSTSNTIINALPESNNKRRNGLGQESVQCASTISTTTTASQRTSKKTKSENPTSTGNAKRKEKLGERIAALQQLVSPFGKILHQCFTKRWDTSGSCTIRFRFCARLTCNACLHYLMERWRKQERT